MSISSGTKLSAACGCSVRTLSGLLRLLKIGPEPVITSESWFENQLGTTKAFGEITVMGYVQNCTGIAG